jgi:hypothetical protein
MFPKVAKNDKVSKGKTVNGSRGFLVPLRRDEE